MGIRKNFAYNSILTLSTYILGIITFPYVSRVLGVSNIGIVSFVDNTINYFVLFSTLGLGIIGTRAVAKNRDNKEKLSSIYSSLIILFLLYTSLTIIIYILSIQYIPKLNSYRELLYIGIAKLIFSVFLIEWFYKGLENFRYITIRSILVKLIYILALFLFVKEKDDYKIYFALTTLTVVINSIINLIYSKNFIQFSLKNISFKAYFKQSIFLGSYAILTSMYTTFNVMYLGFSTNTIQVGYYWTALTIYSIILGFFTAFTGVMMPRMSLLLSQGNMDEFKKMATNSFSILFSICFPIIILSGILAPHLIKFIAGVGYEGAIIPMKIIMPLVMIVGIAQILAVQVLMPLQKDKSILFASIIGACIGILMNILLVKSNGSIGSAIVLIFSETAVTSYYAYIVWKNNILEIPWRIFFINLLFAIPYFFICYGILLIFHNSIIIVILSAFLSIIYFVFTQAFIFKDQYLWTIIKPFLRN